MAADPLIIALQVLPHDADHLAAALAGAGAGARVLPVLRRHSAFAPIEIPMGVGRSPWEGATRDPEKLRRLFADHPGAIATFVDRTEAGLRARVWSGGRLITIPTVYVKG
ncbi:hypothetical protein VSX64_19885 [Aurantimonas sp. C2-6-R+9]|uniref:hypothetical protein n=1 Tax=unclassified Aurantimonas TaxID=2638230 RepID=UPI002E1955D1|nr:hypothetical protein [Aurantimonas sp. C2-6-R+9]